MAVNVDINQLPMFPGNLNTDRFITVTVTVTVTVTDYLL
jgi:hypothetical protein